VHLIETLTGKGYELRLYDRNVNMASLTGIDCDVQTRPLLIRDRDI
jgi:hypothetical protein